VFAGSVLLAESPHRKSALLVLRDQLTPSLAPFFWSPRHAASIRDRLSLRAKWCSWDG
jgi:hypothetical protein